jgi:hypothetical protein
MKLVFRIVKIAGLLLGGLVLALGILLLVTFSGS